MAQALGTPAEPLMCMFGAVQGMSFFLRTGFGDSTTSYSSDKDLPYQGLIQGNGAAPALWLMISSFLIWYLRQQGHGINVLSAISNTVLTYVALVYVDDGDFPTIASSDNESFTDTVTRHQACVNSWSGGLTSTGGALKAKKCHWYPIRWHWISGRAKILPANKCSEVISLPNSSACVEKLDPHTATEGMGVWQCPTGSFSRQLTKMDDAISDYTALLSNGFLSRKVTWTSFWGKLWPSLCYPLSTMSFSQSQSSKLVAPLYRQLLPRLGVVATLPTPYRHCTKRYYGLGLPCLHLEKTIEKLNLLLAHYSISSQPGQHLRHAQEEL